MSGAVSTVLSGFHFLEAPRWREDRIWFSDFYAHRVYSARADGSELREEAQVDGQPSGLGWLPDGRLLVVSMRDRTVRRREADGTLVVHADLSDRVPFVLNDMVVDAAGRAYVGNFGFDLMGGAAVTPTALYRVDPDGTVTEAATELWFPNGSALTPDGTLLVNETFGNRISAFDVKADGTLAGHRVWAEFGPLPGAQPQEQAREQRSVAPDGGCLDAEGAMWIADATGGRLLRVVAGGTITDEIKPGTNVYACALGGADGKTLFACAAPDFDSTARLAAKEASLIAIPVTVPGA